MDYLRLLNSESVDVVATDPPFNKNRKFNATPGSLSSGASFQDRWKWRDDIEGAWLAEIENEHDKLGKAIQNAIDTHSESMGAFLCFMAVRLLAMHRILKPTGSIFLHCDPTASHYIKMVMDAIFGRENFVNEIVWCYIAPIRRNTNYYKKSHDILFWYAKDWDACKTSKIAKMPLSESTIRRFGKYFDAKGQLTYARLKETNPGAFDALAGVPDNLNEVWMDKYNGTNMVDWWTDIVPIKRKGRGQKGESTGYPTQKPIALYKRLIESASEEGDVVMDPFCGCATTLVASEMIGRQWIGIDLWDDVYGVIEDRLKKAGDLEGSDGSRTRMTLFEAIGKIKRITSPGDIEDPYAGEPAAPVMESKPRFIPPKQKWQRLKPHEKDKYLAEAQAGSGGRIVCASCGIEQEMRYMQRDHINPKTNKRSVNDISNLILLCSSCNRHKRNLLTLDGVREKITREGWMVDREKAEQAEEATAHIVDRLKVELKDEA